MRFLLWQDGEGVSRISDHRECWPAFPQYWKTGRKKITADAVAAAKGLLEGGATEVVVLNGHGLDWPNLLADELPEGARVFKDGENFDSFDGWIHVGAHARCGTLDGFVSHTAVPYLRVSVDGYLATETHTITLTMRRRPMGVVGDAALGLQLGSFLKGTPFLPVKKSISRFQTHPLYSTADSSANTIRSFAKASAQKRTHGTRPTLRRPFKAAFSLDRRLTRYALGKHGLRRDGPSVLAVEVRDWRQDGTPAYIAAQEAALRPYLAAQDDLDLTGEEALRRQNPTKLRRFRQYHVDWVHSNPVAWVD